MRLIELCDPIDERRGVYPAATPSAISLPVMAMNHAVAPWPLTWSCLVMAFILAAPAAIALAWLIAKALVWAMTLAVWLVLQ